MNNRRNTPGMVIILAQIFTCGLQVEHKRYVMAEILPVLVIQPDTQVIGNCLEVDRWLSADTVLSSVLEEF